MMGKGMLKKTLILWEEGVRGGRRPKTEDAVEGLATQKQPPSPGASCLSVCGLIRVRLLMT